MVKEVHTPLNFVRIGTSGALQKDLPVDSWLLSEKAIGFDGLINFYARRNEVSDLAFEEAFTNALDWNPQLTSPYVVDAAPSLLSKLEGGKVVKGVTISAPGFYGPQGRELRLDIADKQINSKFKKALHGRYVLSIFKHFRDMKQLGPRALLSHECILDIEFPMYQTEDFG